LALNLLCKSRRDNVILTSLTARPTSALFSHATNMNSYDQNWEFLSTGKWGPASGPVFGQQQKVFGATLFRRPKHIG